MTKFKVIADSLRVRETPSLEGKIISSLSDKTVVDYIATSEDTKWLLVKKADLEGWAYFAYLVPYIDNEDNLKYTEIFEAVTTSALAKYYWKDRGRPAIGYYKGMALVYAQMYCKLKSGDTAANERCSCLLCGKIQ
jgi:Bacterial SH3 domain